MANFKKFKKNVETQFKSMYPNGKELYLTDIDREVLWLEYLSLFPEDANQIFRERTKHDCQNCRTFVKRFGNIVAISQSGALMSIWDNHSSMEYPYNEVAKGMSKLVKKFNIKSIWRTYEKSMGIDHTTQRTENGDIRWQHLHCTAPQKFIVNGDGINGFLVESKTRQESFHRALSTLSLDAIDTTLELIGPEKRTDDEQYLYKGNEYRGIVSEFRKHKIKFDKIKTVDGKNRYAWTVTAKTPHISGIRNSVIGTLLQDLSEGVDLNGAIGAFESKVAPDNFKRSSKIVSKGMIDMLDKEQNETSC